MADSKKRIALKPHIERIREWVDEGRTDEWIADALGTSASSVQSFRSRNDIYRRDRATHEPVSVFEGVLDHGEQDGWGMWFDPAVADDPIWKEHWAGVESVVVKVAEDAIVLEAAGDAPPDVSQDGQSGESENGPGPQQATPGPVATAAEPAEAPVPEPDRERGRVKWFDPEKGYGFLVRPTGEDLFVHHSEVQGDVSNLTPNEEVEYEVGRNERGPNARRVRPAG